MSCGAQDEHDMHEHDMHEHDMPEHDMPANDQFGNGQHADGPHGDADGLRAERTLDCDGHQIPGSGGEPLAGTELLAHLDGELSAIASARVAEHLAACPKCAHEAALLGTAGDLVAALPRHEPGADFAERVAETVADPDSENGSAPTAAPRGRLLRLWPAAAAAAVLVGAIATRAMFDRGTTAEAVLSASEEREIASDLYVLTNLETLESVDADELIALVEELDLLEGLEPEMSGLYAAADDGEDG